MRPVRRVYNYYFSPKRGFTKRVTSILGYIPSQLPIFYRAFQHKSSSNHLQNNERLEYLGDAVLGTVVAEYLYKKYANKDEGFLTKMRSRIVSRKSLNVIADKMRLDVLIRKVNDTSVVSPSIMGNALEAFIGAIYLESGYKETRKFIIKNIVKKHLDLGIIEENDDNFKSQLLEWGQKKRIPVRYETIDQYRVDNRDKFKVGVYIDDNIVAIGEEFNKKGAEQNASQKALAILPQLEKNKIHGIT